MAGRLAHFTVWGLLGIGLGCAPTQSADDQHVEKLEAELASLAAETASMRVELNEVKERLNERNERQARLDELRELRERRRAERETPDLRDPFGDPPEARFDVPPPPPTPLPMPGSPPSEAEKPDPAKAFVDSVTCETGRCAYDRQAFEDLLAHPEALARSARVVPAIRDGEPKGYKLYGIRPGSIPKALGFKNGDLILEVNGNALGNLDQTLELYAKLREAETITLLIERKGKRHTLALTAK